MRKGRGLFLLAAMSLVCPDPAFAQSDEGVDPDRPDVTDSTHLVAPGLVQLEMGWIYAHDTAVQSSGAVPILARVGLSNWIELRVGADTVAWQNVATTGETGFGNLQLAAKLRVWPPPGREPVVVIEPAVVLPTADAERGLGSGATDFTVIVASGTSVGPRAHLDVNYGLGSIGAGDGSRFVQHMISGSLGIPVTDKLKPYLEAFWLSRTDFDGAAETTINTGVVYGLGPRSAIDAGVLFGIGGTASDFGVFGGVTLLLGRGAPRPAGAPRTARQPEIRRR